VGVVLPTGVVADLSGPPAGPALGRIVSPNRERFVDFVQPLGKTR
jgi:hypothetical protein